MLRTVRAMIAVGLPALRGSVPNASASAGKLWPSTSATANPNAASLSAIGSSGISDSVATLAWKPLRSTITVRLSSCLAPATSAASHIDPSSSSPSPTMTNTRDDPPRSLMSIAIPMPTDSRWPSDPEWNSTPGMARFGCQYMWSSIDR